MAGLFDSHVRPGLAKSEGAKHKTVAAAFSDIVDNAFFHGEAHEGAKHVVITLGPEANPHLKALPDGANWLCVADDGKGLLRDGLEWGLLARGPCAEPDGTKVVSFFNTGHHASFNKLGGQEVLIATARDGTGTLVRWGKAVVDAINTQFPPKHANELKVRSAYLQFDMATGQLLALSGTATPEERSNWMISLAAFGIQQLGFSSGGMGFPMDDVTPVKLFSLFAGLSATKSGTNVYTSTRVVTPSEDGMQHIMAGDVRLEEHLCNRWWLPPSSQLPWTLDVPRGGCVSKRPFEVTLVCNGVSRRVDWFAHAWESVVKAGAASKPDVLDFNGHKLHYQIGWLDPNDPAQEALSGQILFYRHARYTCAEALPRKGGSAQLRSVMTDCMEANNRIEAAGPRNFPSIHERLQRIYDGGWPVAKADMSSLTKVMLRTLMGESVVMIVSCHAFQWQEGKEAFATNDVYPACLPALYSAAAKYAHTHPGHPAVVRELELLEAAKAARKAAAAQRAENAKSRTPAKPAGAPCSPAGVDRSARVRKSVQQYEPAPLISAKKNSSSGGDKKRKASDDGAAAVALKKVKQLVSDASSDWRKSFTGAPEDVHQFVAQLLGDIKGALKMADER